MLDERAMNQECAKDLLAAVWRKFPFDRMTDHRKMGIWEEFVPKVKSAAHTDRLEVFIERLCHVFGVGAPTMDERVLDILNDVDHDAVLELLREETRTIALMLRVEQEERRERYETIREAQP